MSCHPVEQRLLSACGVATDQQLRRLGIFLVAHTVMDVHLISVLVDHEIGRIGGVGLLSFEQQRNISHTVSRLTFAQHLQQARSLIPARAAAIAEEVNRGRDSFVHFKQDRFELPHYDGLLVTDDAGFQACMNGVQEFLHLVPLLNPGWSANP
jgi:hypothetical protein